MMDSKTISVEEFAADNLKKWKDGLKDEDRKKEAVFPVITLNMQAGSRGYRVARMVAERLGFDLLHTELLDEMAKTGKVSKETLSSVEKGRLSGLEDLVSSIIDDRYLHADTYMKYLKSVVNSIGKTGRAVIVGRGANFILPPEKRFAVRVISPMEFRIKHVMEDFDALFSEARKRIKKRGSARKSFIRENFHEDIQNPENYDLIINTAVFGVEAAVEAVIGGYIGAQNLDRFRKCNGGC